jgi:hypothetical protein
MSRRSRTNDSSLELLLDTICNTFGGILFLAILVSVLLQTRRDRVASSVVPEAQLQPAIPKADIVRLSTEVAEVVEQLKEAERELARVRSFVAEHSTPALGVSLEKLHAEQVRQRELEVERTSMLAAIAADNTAAVTASSLASTRRETSQQAEAKAKAASVLLSQAQKRHESLRQLAALLQKKVNDKNVIQTVGKAPRERETDKREFGVLVRYGRAYLTHLHDNFDRVVNTRDFTVKVGMDLNTATAKPGAGLDICAPDADARLQELLSRYPATDWYPCFVVHPDSYDAFQVLKAKLVAQGYEYRLVPTAKAVADQGGHGRVQ